MKSFQYRKSAFMLGQTNAEWQIIPELSTSAGLHKVEISTLKRPCKPKNAYISAVNLKSHTMSTVDFRGDSYGKWLWDRSNEHVRMLCNNLDGGRRFRLAAAFTLCRTQLVAAVDEAENANQ